MIPKFGHRSAILLATVALAHTGCGGSPTSPSNVPSVIQGTVVLGSFHLAVIDFNVDSAGTLSTRVDWNSANADIDSLLLLGGCTIDEIITEGLWCGPPIAEEYVLGKPSVLSASVQRGPHTLVIINFGAETETCSYRLEGFVSGATSPVTSELY